MAGQEGFEPPTPGFGVRCSTNSSYWPTDSLFRLFVRRMGPAERTIFFELEFARCILFVFRRRVIATFARTACKGYYISHFITSCLRNNYPTPVLERGKKIYDCRILA